MDARSHSAAVAPLARPRDRADSAGPAAGVAAPSRLLLRGFNLYTRRFLRRHFHGVRVSRSGLPPAGIGCPVVLFSNHASWWDPLMGLFLNDVLFPDHAGYAPMDAEALQRYALFRKLGFFGIERDSRRGAIQFLRAAESILSEDQGLLCITPQGRFADVRERPVKFEPGLGHLARRVDHAIFLPLAIEYVFWNERLPEVLLRFGDFEELKREEAAHRSAAEWTRIFEERMSVNQAVLSEESRRRDSGEFELLLRGGSGQGGIYDLWRGAMARLRGEKFQREHGNR